jgi:hypothetical protein
VLAVAVAGAGLAVAAPAPAATNAEVSIGDASIHEGTLPAGRGRNVSLAVTLSERAAVAVNVPYTINLVSAEANDIKVKSGTVKFTVGPSGFTASKKQVVVRVNHDAEVEGDESFEVALGTPTGGYGLSAKSVGIGTIVDDDPNSGIQLNIGDASIVEGDGEPMGDNFDNSRGVQFAVTLSEPSATEVSVKWNTDSITANCRRVYYKKATVANQDCSRFESPAGAPAPKTLKFKPGSTVKLITVLVLDDEEVEDPDETFQVTLSDPTGGASIADGIGIGTIIDDDPDI